VAGGYPLTYVYTITKLPITIVPLPSGYVEVGRDGGVFTFGGTGFFGSMAGQAINGAVVGLAETVDQKGYWLAQLADGESLPANSG